MVKKSCVCFNSLCVINIANVCWLCFCIQTSTKTAFRIWLTHAGSCNVEANPYHMYGLSVFTCATPLTKLWYIQNIAVSIQIWVTWGRICPCVIRSI